MKNKYKGGIFLNVHWFSKQKNGIATLYETNITLNTVASSYFEEAFAVLIGYDKSDNSIVVKSIDKEESMLEKYRSIDLHKVSVKPSYGRINAKEVVKGISRVYPLDFSRQKMYKFNCEWNTQQKFLKIFLDKEVLE